MPRPTLPTPKPKRRDWRDHRPPISTNSHFRSSVQALQKNDPKTHAPVTRPLPPELCPQDNDKQQRQSPPSRLWSSVFKTVYAANSSIAEKKRLRCGLYKAVTFGAQTPPTYWNTLQLLPHDLKCKARKHGLEFGWRSRVGNGANSRRN